MVGSFDFWTGLGQWHDQSSYEDVVHGATTLVQASHILYRCFSGAKLHRRRSALGVRHVKANLDTNYRTELCGKYCRDVNGATQVKAVPPLADRNSIMFQLAATDGSGTQLPLPGDESLRPQTCGEATAALSGDVFGCCERSCSSRRRWEASNRLDEARFCACVASGRNDLDKGGFTRG